MLKRLFSALAIVFIIAAFGLLPGSETEALAQQVTADPSSAVLVVHGGAGTIERDRMTEEQDREYRAALTEALQAGYDVIQQGGNSLDATVAAIQVMEENPLFNAGRGAVFTNERTVEHDASIMYGRDLNAGATSGTKTVRSPIALARAVMDHSPHVMLSGDGAETFAQEQGLEQVPNEHFYTERRLRQIERALEQESDNGPSADALDTQARDKKEEVSYLGTVGAVALDQQGDIAAGTSTGGMTNKRFGRIGDSPIIGAGTYADNETAGISSTGHGEYFIRAAVAHDIVSRMRYQGVSLDEAANSVIHEKLVEMGGTGGIVALDRDGNVSMPHNTPGMYRGFIDQDGNVDVRIYGDEDQ